MKKVTGVLAIFLLAAAMGCNLAKRDSKPVEQAQSAPAAAQAPQPQVAPAPVAKLEKVTCCPAVTVTDGHHVR